MRESETRLKEAQHNAHIGSWTYLPPDTFLCSEEMYQLFKLPHDVPMTHDAVLSVMHPEDQKGRYKSAFKRALEAGEVDFRSEYRVIWPDSQIRWMSSIGKIRRDEEGRVIDAVGTVQDITERKRIEETLRKSDQEYRLLFEQIPDGIFIADARGCYLDVNPAGVELMGYAPDELRGLTLPDLLPSKEVGRLSLRDWSLRRGRRSAF